MAQLSTLTGVLSGEFITDHVSDDGETFYRTSADFGGTVLQLLASEYVLCSAPIGVLTNMVGYLVPNGDSSELLFHVLKISKETKSTSVSCNLRIRGRISHTRIRVRGENHFANATVKFKTPNGKVTTQLTAEGKIARDLGARQCGEFIDCVCELTNTQGTNTLTVTKIIDRRSKLWNQQQMKEEA